MSQAPRVTGDRLEAILEMLYIYFRGDRDKVTAWLRTPNPGLDNQPPMQALEQGEPEKLMEVIREMIDRM